MKDHLTLIAAATGGFMLSIAVSGIIKTAPVTFLNSPSSLSTAPIANFQNSSTPVRFEKRSNNG